MDSTIRRYAFKPGLPVEFEIISISDIYKANKDILTVPHRTDFYHIIWFTEGNSSHLVDFNPIDIEPNTLLFIDKDTVHFFDRKSSFSAKAILFTENFFGSETADIRYLRTSLLFHHPVNISKINVLNDFQFETLWHCMEDQLAVEDKYQQNVLKHLLYSFMLLSERELTNQGYSELPKNADWDATLLFKDQVEQKFKHQRSVGSYAEDLAISDKRLTQATAKTLGKTPKQIIDERLLLETKRLLVHGSNSIKEIAYDLGFDEPTNFIKYFKKHTGKTPSEFRDNYRISHD
jgi:AraC family transcriptional regulator, transcriptional activator of pobA